MMIYEYMYVERCEHHVQVGRISFSSHGKVALGYIKGEELKMF